MPWCPRAEPAGGRARSSAPCANARGQSYPRSQMPFSAQLRLRFDPRSLYRRYLRTLGSSPKVEAERRSGWPGRVSATTLRALEEAWRARDGHLRQPGEAMLAKSLALHELCECVVSPLWRLPSTSRIEPKIRKP